MKHLALLVALAACSKTNDVTLLLGPTEDRISRGFLCKDAAGNFLMQDVLAAGQLRFNLVVDVVSLAGHFPGCRGEELVELCSDPANCNGTVRRQCIDGIAVPFPMPFNLNTDIPKLATAFKAAIHNRLALDNLSDDPVIVRVVATKQPCSDIDATAIDENLAVGCAYSCPVQLDQVAGSISVSIDTLDDFCEPQVRACAAFPRRAR